MIFIFSSRLNCRRFLLPAPSPALIAISRRCNMNTAQSNNHATDQIRKTRFSAQSGSARMRTLRLFFLRRFSAAATPRLARKLFSKSCLPFVSSFSQRPCHSKKISNTRFIPNLHTDRPFPSFFSLKTASAPGTAEQPVRTWDHADVPCLFFSFYLLHCRPCCDDETRSRLLFRRQENSEGSGRKGRPPNLVVKTRHGNCRCLPRSYFVYSASVDRRKAEGTAGSPPGQRLKKSE